MHYLIHPLKTVVALVTSLVFLLLSIMCLLAGSVSGAIIFLPFFLLYLFILAKVGARIMMDESGITCRFLFFPAKVFFWSEVQEVGIANLKVLQNSHARKKTGALYLYFSKTPMDEDGRFRMCMEWPPKDKLYLQYSADRLENLRQFWTGRIVQYNIDEWEFSSTNHKH